MPLIFKAKANNNPNNPWRGLDFNSHYGLLVWNDYISVAGNTPGQPKVKSVAEQARAILSEYNVFAYQDMELIDLDGMADFLNKRGALPDFSEKTLERGWLAPNGDFIGCHYGHHADLLKYTLDVSTKDAKRDGWIAVQPKSLIPANSKLPATPEQQDTLKKLQFIGDKRASVPDYTDDFERVRNLYVSDDSRAPRLLDYDEAQPIIIDVKGALDKIEIAQISMICKYTQATLGGNPDGQHISDMLSRGNQLVLKTADDYKAMRNAIR